MLWRTNPKFSHKILAQLYKIQPKLLAQHNAEAWTNLGYWQTERQDYVQAASKLAQHMGQTLALKPSDQLLDIGCGYGASLSLWHTQFGLNHLTALELQPICCTHLKQQQWHYVKAIFQQSIFDEKPVGWKQCYDVIISIDATYHYAVQMYLQALEAWIAKSGRIGFHLLLKDPRWQTVSSNEKRVIAQRLKWAKIDIKHIHDQQKIKKILEQYGYEDIEIKDLTQPVLQGFYEYIAQKKWSKCEQFNVGFLKIYLTARLCHTLATSQVIQYVQITAKKQK